MSRAPRICYAGTYERHYPRNRLVITALRASGAWVEEAHVPVFERVRDKSGVGPRGALRLAARLALAYALLVPEVALRLLRCDALAVGYIGQGDMLVLGALGRAMGRTVIFNPLVTLTDTLVEDRRIVSEDSRVARALRLIDRVALRLADVVLVDTEETGQFLIERFRVPAAKLVVVPAGAEERVFFPPTCHPEPQRRISPSARVYAGTERSFAAAQDDTPRESGLSNDYVQSPERLDVLFVGTFIPLHGIDTILHAAALLEERGSPVKIELVGTGQTYAAMRELAARLGIGASTLTWTDWIPYDALRDRHRRADVALGVFDAGPKAARVVPNKVYQSLACGVATITRDTAPVRRLLRDGEDGLLIPPADPAALADAIERLLSPAYRARIASGGLAAFREHASEAALSRAVAPVVASLRRT